jgi:hypothetical protein
VIVISLSVTQIKSIADLIIRVLGDGYAGLMFTRSCYYGSPQGQFLLGHSSIHVALKSTYITHWICFWANNSACLSNCELMFIHSQIPVSYWLMLAPPREW